MYTKKISLLLATIVLVLATNSYSATTISRLPYTISSSGSYQISSDLSVNSGAGITISASNVVLYGANSGTRIEYSKSGKGYGIDIKSGKSNIEIYNLDLKQVSSYDGSASVNGGAASGVDIHDCKFTIKSGTGAVATAIGLKVSDSSSQVRNCTFNISGVDRFYGFKPYVGAWKIHDNTFTVSNHVRNGYNPYPFVVYASSNMEIYDNDFNIDGQVINGIAAYNRDNVKVHDNVINYASDKGGRMIFPDGGSSNWEIYDNQITVNSQTGDTQYIIRVRGIDGGASNNTKIRRNTVDASNASGPIYLLSLGDNYAITGTVIAENYFKGKYSIFQWYGTANSTDIYCNTIVHTGTSGYPFYIGSRSPSDTNIFNNTLSTNRSDGALIYTTKSNGGVKVCNNDLGSSEIAGGGSVSITGTVCSSSCTDVAGPPVSTPPPDPEPEPDVVPTPVANLAAYGTVWKASNQYANDIWDDSTVTWCVRVPIAGSSIERSVSKFRISFEGRSSGNYTIKKVSIAQKDPNGAEGDIIDSTFRKVTFNNNAVSSWSSNTTVVEADGITLSDEIDMQINQGTDYYITYMLDSPGVYMSIPTEFSELYFNGVDHSDDLDWGSNGHTVRYGRVHCVSGILY
jgi:hypothetical protein